MFRNACCKELITCAEWKARLWMQLGCSFPWPVIPDQLTDPSRSLSDTKAMVLHDGHHLEQQSASTAICKMFSQFKCVTFGWDLTVIIGGAALGWKFLTDCLRGRIHSRSKMSTSHFQWRGRGKGGNWKAASSSLFNRVNKMGEQNGSQADVACPSRPGRSVFKGVLPNGKC